MKKLVIGLLLSLLIPIASISQTTYPIIKDSLVIITQSQLKTANLIFNEHQFLKEKVRLLDNQVSDLTKLNSLYIAQDSLRCKEIDEYKKAYEDSYYKYNRLKRYNTVKNVSILVLASVILGLII